MKLIFSSLIFLIVSFSLQAEGFKKGTLVKVPTGYIEIEELNVGDIVVSCDFLTPCVERQVTAKESHLTEQAIMLTIDEEILITENDHKIYVAQLKEFVTVSQYQSQPIEGSVELINITVDDTHNYFVTKSDILVHNFNMAIVRAIPAIGPVVEIGLLAATVGKMAADMLQEKKNDEQKKAKEEYQRKIREQEEERKKQESSKEETKTRKKTAAESLPDLSGKSADEARQALKDAGYKLKGQRSPEGWEAYTHPDGSKIDIGKTESGREGRVVRNQAPKYGPDGSRINKGQRVDKNGNEIPRPIDHSEHPKETLKDW